VQIMHWDLSVGSIRHSLPLTGLSVECVRRRSKASLRNRPSSAASPTRGSAAPSPAPPPLPEGYLCELDEMRKSAMAERLLFDEEAQEELEEARPSLGGSPNPSRPSSAMSTASARKRRPASAMSGSSKSRTKSSSPIRTFSIEELAERERDRQVDLLRSIRCSLRLEPLSQILHGTTARVGRKGCLES
jgi:hypothetical protein